MEDDVVPGASAAQVDVWSRLAWLAAVVLGIVAIALISGDSPGGIGVLAVSIVAVISAIVLSVASSRIAGRERALGYSTVFDAPGYALRDPRTKQVQRPADEAPMLAGRRSALRAMLTVKPGTVLAKRIDDDEA